MKLLLVRHAESTANKARALDTLIPGPSLTPEGRIQAVGLIETLESARIDAIYASVMQRTSETALPLSAARHLPITLIEGLHEIEAGHYEGATDPASENSYRAVIADWAKGTLTTPIPGAFEGNHFLARFDEGIDTIRRRSLDDASVVVVTHSVAIRVWVGTRTTNASPAFTATTPLDNVGIVEVDIDTGGGVTLRRWQNERAFG